jgi:hypothetical protein
MRKSVLWHDVTIACGVIAMAVGVAACSGQAGTPAAAPASTAPASPTSQGKGAKTPSVRGRISAENGTTWTVVGAKGQQYTVDIGPQTKFGTAKAPVPQSQFTVGTSARFAGTVTGSTVAATRVSAVKKAAATPPPSPTPTA